MADQDIMKLAHEWLNAQSTGDYHRMGATLADDVVYSELGTQRRIQGRQALINLQQEWRQVFPDVKGTLQNIFVSGNQALAEMI
jgi:ketosteroid isomerase-like protein